MQPKLEKFFELSNNLLLVLDRDGTIKKVNPSLQKVLGFQEIDMIGRTFDRFVHPMDFLSTWEAMKTLDQGASNVKIENQFATAFGIHLHIEWDFTHEPESDSLFVIGKDITSQKKKELLLKRLNESLKRKLDDFEQFAHIISHNLRAPVANILGLTDLIGTAVQDQVEPGMFVDKLQVATRRMDQVVRDLNKILWIRSDVRESKEMVSLDRKMKGVLESLENELVQSHSQVLFDFSKAPKLRLYGPYLESILLNLVQNAITFRHPDRDPVIHITSEHIAPHVKLTISDNGRGIDLGRHRDKVFQLYQKFHPDSKGEGLGLHMVWQQVKVLGGKISVESKVDEGTEFHIVFDQQFMHEPPELSKIFLIDDDAIANLIHQQLIEKISPRIECKSFENPVEALEKIIDMRVDECPDLIILDLNMFEISGWEFLEVLGTLPVEKTQKIRVIILSSSSIDKDKIMAGSYPIVRDFITKPMPMENWKNVLPVIDTIQPGLFQ